MSKSRSVRRLISKKALLAVAGLVGVASVLTFTISNVFAVGSLYITPPTSSVNINSNVTVSVRLNPGTSVDAVEARIQYDRTKLEFVSINDSGSAFTLPLQQVANNGTISIDRGIIGSVTTDSLVARVTFKALAGSGSTTLNISGNAAWAGQFTSPSSSTATINLTSPTPPPPDPDPNPDPDPDPNPDPDPDPNPDDNNNNNTNNNTNNNPNSPTPTRPASPPAAPTPKDDPNSAGVEVTPPEIEFTRARFSLNTAKEARVMVKFGLTQENLNLHTQQTPFGKNHEIVLDENFLLPGTTFYYQVVADTDKGTTVSELATFKTKGYTVKITVQDKNGSPIKSKKFTLRSDPLTARSDKRGTVEFTDVAPGEHTLEYEAGRTKHAKVVLVEDAIQIDSNGKQVATVQNMSVVYDELVLSDLPMGTIIALCVALAVIGGLIIFAVSSKGSNRPLGGLKFRINKQKPVTPGIITQDNLPNDASLTPGNTITGQSQPDAYKAPSSDQHNPGAVINPTTNGDPDKDA